MRSSLSVDGCGQQFRTAWGWAWDASGVPCMAQNKSALLLGRGQRAGERKLSPISQENIQVCTVKAGTTLQGLATLLFPDTFFYNAKGQWKWSVVVLCPKCWLLLSLLLIAGFKWLWNDLTVTECRFGACVYKEVEVNQLRDVWNRHSWQHAAKRTVGWICILFNTSKKVLSCDLQKSSQEQ